MGSFVLKGGNVVSGQGESVKDIFVENGKVVESLSKNAEIIDCSGLLVLPGLIDTHVHFRQPGQEYKEDFESGTRAAVAGGVTTICDMPNNVPPVLSVKDLEKKRSLVGEKVFCNFGLYIGYDGKNIDEINKAEGVVAVKLYHAHSTGNMGVNDEVVEKLFRYSNKLIVAHAEDEECIKNNFEKLAGEGADFSDTAIHSRVRSPECAARSVQRLCELAYKYGKKLHVAHVSSEAELEVLEKFKAHGVTCEIAPHHLFLTADDYPMLRNFAKMNPPLRNQSDVFAAWKALKSGLIDMVATDHAPHSIEEKELSYVDAPSGVPELDTLLPLMMNAVDQEGLALSEVVRVCCEKPAGIFGLVGKGFLDPGCDADIVVVDPEIEKIVQRKDLRTKCGWSPYEGLKLKGWPVKTFVNGVKVFENGDVFAGGFGKEVVVNRK